MTISQLEPSYVIQKFLDSQHNDNLINYLEELHRKKKATKDHTTLLLRCYMQIRNSQQTTDHYDMAPVDPSPADIEIIKQKLEAFFNTDSFVMDVNYDPNAAIKTLRQAGYRENALDLAKRFGEHDWVIKILIEDYSGEEREKRMLEALQHIESLSFEEAEHYMKRYGKILISVLPSQTTNFMIRLCTKHEPVLDRSSDRVLKSFDNADYGNFDLDDDVLLGHRRRHSASLEISCARAEEFIFCFMDSPYWLMVFLENVVFRLDHMDQHHRLSPATFSTLLELFLKYWDKVENVAVDGQHHQQEQLDQRQQNDIGDHLATYEDMYIRIEGGSLPKNSSPRYDTQPPDTILHSKSFRGRCMYLLEKFQHGSFDLEHALVLTQCKRFNDGVLFLYEKLGLNFDIVQYHIERGDFDSIIEVANRHKDDRSIWIQVLSYFAGDAPGSKLTGPILEQRISQLLRTIKQYDILPPLLVVDILTQNENVPLGLIKDYLVDRMSQEQTKTSEYNNKIRKLQLDTKKLQDEVEELRTSAKIFQFTTCNTCSEQLDLPAVHFMCMHSYHQRCLSDIEECPKCSRKNKDAVVQSTKYDSSQSHETFFKMLQEEKNNGFDVIATYFGRGIFKQNVFHDVEDE